jgi:hypothetical protein
MPIITKETSPTVRRSVLQRIKRALLPRDRRMGRGVVLIILLSVVIRVTIALYLGDQVPLPENAPDETSYSYLAERLAAGYGYSFDRPWYPFGKPAGYPTAHWSFLYTAFLAGVYKLLGPHPLFGRLAGAVVGGVLLPLVVYRLARRLFPDREQVALLSAGGAALYAYFALYAARLMTESLYIVALLWSIDCALALATSPRQGATDGPTARQAVLLGLSLGISSLLRQSILPWAVVLFAWLLWAGWRAGVTKRMVLSLTVAGSIMMLLILPFTVRNYRVYDDFLLLNSNAGYAMYSAQHPMHGTSFQEYAAAPIPQDLLSGDLSEAQLDRALMRRGIEFVVADPGRYLLLSLSRVRDYFECWPTADSSPINNVGRTLSITIALPFMLGGLWLTLRRQGPWRSVEFSTTPLALVLLFMIFYSVLHILTWSMARYRMPVDAVALPFAALAVSELALTLSAGLRRRNIAVGDA